MTESGNTYFMEEGYEDWMRWEVEPYLQQHGRFGSFLAVGKMPLHYYIFKSSRTDRCIVISHGFCEFAEKYNELIYYFLKAGVSVYLLEHRGHGRSGRETLDAEMVHVGDFGQYVEDFARFMEQVVTPAEKHCYLFAHSMGGAIGILLLEKYPKLFEGAVLSAPMCRMQTGKYPLWVAYLAASVNCLLGRQKQYAAGQGGFRDEPDYAGSSCLSEARYRYVFEKRLADKSCRTYGGSYGWVRAGIRAGWQLMRRQNLRRIQIPVLLFAAGRDHMVDNREIRRFARRTTQTEYLLIPEAKHEIFNAGYRTRKLYYEKIFHFIKEERGEQYETEADETGKILGTL